jgi:beta-glucosidase
LQESSNIDDRTIHELYAYPFLKSVEAGVGSIMCSYNQVNNSYACTNPRTLNEILKSQFEFEGFVMSDWWASNTNVPSVLAGLDMMMPGNPTWNAELSSGNKIVLRYLFCSNLCWNFECQ